MTQTFSLAPVPFWYFPDATGKPLGSGKMFTYSSLDNTEYKPVFQDLGGNNAWPQPVLFDLNGTQGPFYWEFDDTKPEEFYFIQIFDSNNNLVYEIDDFPGPGGGGGGTVTTVSNTSNYIVNNAFLYNFGNSVGQIGPSIPNQTLIAPGAHSELIFPDYVFFNTGPGAVDTITFTKFNTGTNALTGDFNSAYYLNYTSDNAGSGNKGIQFAASPNVNTLQNQQMIFTLWAQSIGGGANTLQIYVRQYFGSGSSASPENVVQVGLTLTLSNSWQPFEIPFTMPSIAGKTLGGTGDDATYMEIRFPVGSACNINIAKPSLYAGSSAPESNFESNEQIAAQLQTPRTGDVKMGGYVSSLVPGGWLYLDDKTIGSPTSAAGHANINTWFLYSKLWTSVSQPSANARCPVVGGLGISAAADWDANKPLTLPPSLANVFANASTTPVSHPLASETGAEGYMQQLSDLAQHTHNQPSNGPFVVAAGSATQLLTGTSANQIQQAATTGNVTGRGTQTAIPLLQPTTYLTAMIKL